MMSLPIFIKKNLTLWPCMAIFFLQDWASIVAHNDSIYPTSYKTIIQDMIPDPEKAPAQPEPTINKSWNAYLATHFTLA
jgi:hypothetical protein